MKNITTIIFCLLVLVSCNRKPNETGNQTPSHQMAVQYILDNEDSLISSIAQWTDDSIKANYPELVIRQILGIHRRILDITISGNEKYYHNYLLPSRTCIL